MIIVIPVSREDACLIDDTKRAFDLNPPGANHQLLVVGCPMVSAQVAELASLIGYHFKAVTTHILPGDNTLGWPMSCNYYFQQTCYFLKKDDLGEKIFLWYEMDSVPLVPGWASELEREYSNDAIRCTRDGKPRNFFMGVVQDTYLPVGGRLVSFEESGVQMAAVGIYPVETADLVKTLPTISASPKPWYEFIRWYTCHLNGCYNTPLIQNNWKTVDYRYADESIACDSIVNWAWDKHFNDPVKDDAVLVHGCKDGSLLKLIEADMLNNTEESDVMDEPSDELPKPRKSSELPSYGRLDGRACRGRAGRIKRLRMARKLAKEQALEKELNANC